MSLSSFKRDSFLEDGRTSQDCIGVRSSQERAQALQEEIDGEIHVALLMLDRFPMMLKAEKSYLSYVLLRQELGKK
jgi:hypothetical protein